MRSYLLLKLSIVSLKKIIFIFFTGITFIFISFNKSFGEENIFTINNIKVKGGIDVNFSRDKYLNRAFSNSFEMLMNKILLTRDLKKVDDIQLEQIKKLINSFNIEEESYRENTYRANITVIYNSKKIKKFLSKKNVSFSLTENISAVFFPVFYINDEIQSFEENFFYKNWNEITIKNELINFILPLEDLEDISKVIKFKDNIENLDFNSLVEKYNTKNYVFALMNFENSKLNIYLKTNFNDNKTSKNIFYKFKNITDELLLTQILKELKFEVVDIWKGQNIINLLTPLSINLKFQHSELKNLDKLRSVFDKIAIIENYNLEEFNIQSSLFKIYYYGGPKNLRTNLSKFGYRLINDQGVWRLILNE